MTKLNEIIEALNECDYPEHEFRGYCWELLGRLDIAEKALMEIEKGDYDTLPLMYHMRLAKYTLAQLKE